MREIFSFSSVPGLPPCNHPPTTHLTKVRSVICKKKHDELADCDVFLLTSEHLSGDGNRKVRPQNENENENEKFSS